MGFSQKKKIKNPSNLGNLLWHYLPFLLPILRNPSNSSHYIQQVLA